MKQHHPAVASLLKFFAYEHIPPHLQQVSKPIGDLAHQCAEAFEGPELAAGLRKLLEAKDCMVRAALESAVRPGPAPVNNPATPPDRT
jgi:hypothetical protein